MGVNHSKHFCGECGLEEVNVKHFGICQACYDYAMTNQLTPCFECGKLTANSNELCSMYCRISLANKKFKGNSIDAFSDERNGMERV